VNPSLVLIDTSVWLLSLGKSAQTLVKDRVRELLEENRVAITPMITLEILGGARTEEEFNRLKSRLYALHQIPLGEKDWEEAASTAFRLRRRGKAIPYTDILIAMAAIKVQALLLHADHHFGMIAESTGLSQESLLPLLFKE
jgi:predicted nucleic acid-binding protein